MNEIDMKLRKKFGDFLNNIDSMNLTASSVPGQSKDRSAS